MNTRLFEDNALRFVPDQGEGHVESYFLRANHPTRALSVWLKATVLATPGGAPLAELWGIVFDGEGHRVWAHKQAVPFAQARFLRGDCAIEIAGARLVLDDPGEATGALERGSHGALRWDLRWQRASKALGAPLCLFPLRAMVDGSFPRSKLLTPAPLIRVHGHLQAWGERLVVDDWIGMQGHNWGKEHAWEYAWGQCHFMDGAGEPFCAVEGFSGRIRLAGLVSPLLSAMVVRRGEREYRFDRVFNIWRQRAAIEDLGWRLSLRGPGGEAALEMRARPDDTVCLGYANPNGRLSHCFNSKLARVTLRVNPYNEEGFSCTSEHGGALELLRNEPDPRFEVV